MKKIEANTLEEAYDIACREFGCSITELKYEIVQYPLKGMFGLFSKKAIIVADRKEEVKQKLVESNIEYKSEEDNQKEPVNQRVVESNIEHKSEENNQKELKEPEDKDIDNIETQDFNKIDDDNDINKTSTDENDIIDNFFSKESKKETPSNIATKDNKELAKEIEDDLKRVIASSCFNIDTIEVDVEDNTALIFIDGEDAALLIGKEGYRYNALSYLLFNWIYPKYGLYIKLEIARFLQTQSEMIRNYIQPVVEHVERNGWGKTRPLDGILAQIALEQLRDRFPNKYVAIKNSRDDDKRYVIINDFIKSY